MPAVLSKQLATVARYQLRYPPRRYSRVKILVIRILLTYYTMALRQQRWNSQNDILSILR